jgi:hypothetical protein
MKVKNKNGDATGTATNDYAIELHEPGADTTSGASHGGYDDSLPMDSHSGGGSIDLAEPAYYPATKVNFVQGMARPVFHLVMGEIVPAAVFLETLTKHGVSLPKQPYLTVMKAGAILSLSKLADVIHHLTERKYPFSSASWAGALAWTAATLPPLLTSLGLGFAYERYGNLSDATGMSNYSKTLAGLEHDPLINLSLLALLIHLMHGVGEKIIDCCLDLKKANEEAADNIIQNFLKVIPGVLNALGATGVTHMVLRDNLGRSDILQDKKFLMVVVAWHQTLEMLAYMIKTPEPINTLVPREEPTSYSIKPTIGDFDGDSALEIRAPSSAQRMNAVAYYTGRCALAITAGVFMGCVVNNFLSKDDKEKMESALGGDVHVVTALCVATVTGLTGQVIDNGFRLGKYACGGLYNLFKKAPKRVDEVTRADFLKGYSSSEEVLFEEEAARSKIGSKF